jgi:hypothetical protein
MKKGLMKNKKGLSGIIITLIIIGLSLVLIGTVWFVVSGVVENSVEDTESSASKLIGTCEERGYIKIKDEKCYGDVVYASDGKCCSGYVPDKLSGLVGYWALDGNAKDSSGKGNHGTEYGGINYVEGISGEAAEFDGVDDYVDLNLDYFTDWNESISISSWIYIPSSHIWETTYLSTLITNKGGYQGSFGIIRHINDNVIRAWLRHDNGAIAVNTDITRNNWYNLIITWDGSELTIYNNGKFIGSDATIPIGIPDTPNWVMSLPRPYSGTNSNSFYEGKIDEVRIYNRALTEDEINILYNYPLI